MKKKVVTCINKLNPFFDKMGRNPYLQAVSAAMMSTFGPIFIGSICVLIVVLMRMNETLSKLTNVIGTLDKVNAVTLGASAIYVAILMAYHLVKKLDEKEDALTAGVISLVGFLIITPLDETIHEATSIPTTWLGSQGMFSALIVGIISARLYLMIKRQGWTIKMPAGVPPMVTRMFEGLIPTVLIGILFGIIAFIFSLTSFGSMHQFVFSIIQEPLKNVGGSIGAVIFLSLLQQLLWFYGIHGTNIIMPIVKPLWIAMDMENIAAFQAGNPMPNIAGYAFFSIVTFGGSALGLVLLMLMAKSKQYKEVGKISLLPALFGITEPVIFGTPLVLNFDLSIPFITNNTIALIIAYVLTKIGIVASCSGVRPLIGLPLGVYATAGGAVSIIILHLLIQLVLFPLLWYPWFKRLDNKTYLAELEAEK